MVLVDGIVEVKAEEARVFADDRGSDDGEDVVEIGPERFHQDDGSGDPFHRGSSRGGEGCNSRRGT